MMRKIIALLIFIILFAFSATPSLAIYDPLSVPNNIYGIHIFSEKDLPDAASLVNSQSGDWGYVTVVISQTERDTARWQKVFDEMRRDHLIPIVRIASKANGDTWETPSIEDIPYWVSFLNSVNWVIENRYVVISNEPNHASEWGGKVDPEAYGKYLKEFSHQLKSASNDFYVLPAGLDASAKNSRMTMDEAKFIKSMLKADPSVFDSVEGWTSHSYPNPDFSGKPTDIGRGSVDTFDWELTYLKSLGVNKNLPVFITETGWSNKSLNEDQISTYLKSSFDATWKDSRVVAVTPFILNYPQSPFDQFTWKKADGTFYKFYDEIRRTSKTAGAPIQIERGTILAAFDQPVMLPNSDYYGGILARNTGQSIWYPTKISIGSESNNIFVKNIMFNEIEPNTLGLVIFKAAAPDAVGPYGGSLFIKGSNGQKISNSFLFEAAVVKADQMQIKGIFDKLLDNLRGFLGPIAQR